MRQRQPRKRDEAHLRFIRGLCCCVCLNNIATEAAHVKMAEPKAGKRGIGIGEKADDRWTVPLCSNCHRWQHEHTEQWFWQQGSFRWIDPVYLALALYSVTGDHEAGESIIRAYH